MKNTDTQPVVFWNMSISRTTDAEIGEWLSREVRLEMNGRLPTEVRGGNPIYRRLIESVRSVDWWQP